MTQDASALACSVATGGTNPADYLVLPITVTRSPLGSVHANAATKSWSDIIAWLHYGPDRGGKTWRDPDPCRRAGKSTSPGIQRLLGMSAISTRASASTTSGMQLALKATGNYG